MYEFFKKLGLTKVLFSLLTSVTFILLLAGCSVLLNDSNANINNEVIQDAVQDSDNTIDANEPLTSFAEVSQYIREHQQLPPNYITKEEARQLGWVASEGNLHKVAPGKSIGGDRFGNREGLLPKANGRVWYEADIDYENGTRNGKRIVFSNDGLIYMTTNHYKSFTNITEEGSVMHE